MSGAIFMSILASPAYANLGNPEFASPPQEQLVPSPEPVAPALSTARLNEMLEASVEDLEAYTADLQSEIALSERHLQVLRAMDGLVDDVNDLFGAEAAELSPMEKVSLARRIVENNLKIAKGKLALVGPGEDVVEISFSPEEQTVRDGHRLCRRRDRKVTGRKYLLPGGTAGGDKPLRQSSGFAPSPQKLLFRPIFQRSRPGKKNSGTKWRQPKNPSLSAPGEVRKCRHLDIRRCR